MGTEGRLAAEGELKFRICVQQAYIFKMVGKTFSAEGTARISKTHGNSVAYFMGLGTQEMRLEKSIGATSGKGGCALLRSWHDNQWVMGTPSKVLCKAVTWLNPGLS